MKTFASIPKSKAVATAVALASLLAACLAGWGVRPGAATSDRHATAPSAAKAHATAIHLATVMQPIPVAHLTHATSVLRTFALNALLLPLLDDDVPPRWADPSLSVDCADAQVTVDGAQPVVGEAVGRTRYTVRWRMDRCRPLGAYIELTGEVELEVRQEGDSYHASVRPVALQVASLDGLNVLNEPFVASTPHGLGRSP